ncbi:MAG: PAS domain S-box protein, partial [Desulfohalobiaceae bacterium]
MSANLPEWALKDILNTMNDGLFMVDPRGRIVMVNDALLQTLGYEREDLLGKSCSVLKCDVCKASRARGRDHWCRLFDTRREERKSCRLERKDGSFLHALKNASLLQRNGEVVGAVETVTDTADEAGDTVGDTAGDAAGEAEDATDSAADAGEDAAEAATDTAEEATEATTDAIAAAAEAAEEAAQD